MKIINTPKRKILLVITLVLVGVWWFSLPSRLFQVPYSTVIEDRQGVLLGARIADDGQWRFPQAHQVPEKYAKAVVFFEDEYFYRHLGVNPVSVGRALVQNLRQGRVISGGSTLSMQVIRLSRQGKSRTWGEKIWEMVLATRLEARHSKAKILALYASHAPFGGNVVGLEAATWRYFGRQPHDLSWAEAALLAVLPNSPSALRPGKNQEPLKAKRNRLLTKLLHKGEIDSLTWQLALEEPLPEAPYPLPTAAPHLLSRVIKEGGAGTKVRTSLEYPLQMRVGEWIHHHHAQWLANDVHNAAVVVMEVATGRVLAYHGNVPRPRLKGHGEAIDLANAPRSTGSVLKPFLYAAMQQEGSLLPTTLVPDVPTFIQGFSPKNFSKSYDGAIPAHKALARSLNVPAVHMLKTYKYERFHPLLRDLGMYSLHQPPDFYGLSMILGGSEASLWELTGMYASLARVLENYAEVPGSNRYRSTDLHPPTYRLDSLPTPGPLEKSGVLSAASIWIAFEAMLEVYRPLDESNWELYEGSKKVAWKTGTSFGHRDAWAIGVTPQYAVGVWVGNASGEGRPGLTGVEAAAPLLFDVFSLLPENRWFSRPSQELQQIPVCAQSGHRIGRYCATSDTLWVAKAGLKSVPCPYHQRIHLDVSSMWRVESGCESVAQMQHVNWFVLPPVQEYYFRGKNTWYKKLPPFRQGCGAGDSGSAMQFIYPRDGARVYIPRLLDGQPGKVVFEVAHRYPSRKIYWYIDREFVGQTEGIHQQEVYLKEGKYTLTLTDDTGEFLATELQILSK
jgi:penicillin-binding protein 1C